MSLDAVRKVRVSVCFKKGDLNMQKPSLWLLPVDNTTPHIHHTI